MLLFAMVSVMILVANFQLQLRRQRDERRL